MKTTKLKIITPLIVGAFIPLQNTYSAPEDTFRPYVGYSVTHDDNVFRLKDSAEAMSVLGTEQMADTAHRFEAGIDVDWKISRQQIIAHADISNTKFERFDFLDHDGRNLSAKWNWQLGNLWSGDVGYSNIRSLSSFSEIQARTANLRTQQSAFANARYLIHPSWRIEGGVSSYDLDNSASSLQSLDRTENSVEIGGHYLSRANNSVGLRFKTTEADFPNREFVAGSIVDNAYRQNDLSTVVNWLYRDQVQFQGRAGYTERKHEQLGSRDFSGLTARLLADWAVTGKTNLVFNVWRDIGAVEDLTSSYVLTQGVSIAPRWQATEKIAFRAHASYENRDYKGDPGLAITGQAREDSVFGTGILVSYKPKRNIDLQLSYRRENRDSNQIDSEYRTNIYAARARFEF